MKLLILGMSQHGKDTAAEILQALTGMRWISSSNAANERVVFPVLAPLYGYATLQECFDDRHQHKMEWKGLISAYNTPDKARLCKEILAESDCYVGMRCPLEYAASRHLFDAVLWIDASRRRPPDPSMGIERDSTMILVDNNGPLVKMQRKLGGIAALMGI